MSTITSEKNSTSEIISAAEKKLVNSSAEFNLRTKALEAFKKAGLPPAKSEEYKFTPIGRTLEKNFNFSAVNGVSKSLTSSYAIEGLDAYTVVFVNGVFSKERSSLPAAGISASTLQDALKNNTQLVLKYLGTIADVNTDSLVAWNTATFEDGVFIHVPDNTIIEKPLIIYHIHDTQQGQVVTANRNLFVVGKNSEVTVIEKFDTEGASPGFSNTVTEGFVDEKGVLNIYSIQNDKGNRYQFGLTQVHQADNSRVNTYTFTLSGKLVRNNLQLSLDGENIESHMYGLYLISSDTLADNHTVVDHKKANSFSNELYKGIMDQNSKGVFNGKIYVRPNAQKTNAFQANRNILIGDKSVVNTKPQLEIWADDVKCSHGCTTGQLDEEAVFYLQARGIAKETAQAMMLYAFAGEVLDNVKHPVLKDYFDRLISERLQKDF